MSFLGRQSKSDYPLLPSKVKAAHTNVYCDFLADVVYKLGSPDEFWKLLNTCAWAYSEYWFRCNICKQLFFPKDEDKKAVRAGKLFLLTYQALVLHSLQNLTSLFKLRPKHHYAKHGIDDIEKYHINPLYRECLGEEDFLGKVKKLMKRCHRSQANSRYIARYKLGLCARWGVRLRTKGKLRHAALK
jgi:hypothetical protein